jgi:hypothetical protein
VSAYGTLTALFHDLDRPRADAAEIAWYVARLPQDAGPVLDVMAGWGRLLVPLLEAGFQVHGVDVSEAMLERCARRAADSGRTAQLFRQNATVLNLPTRYAAAFIAGGAFQWLTNPIAALDALLRIRAHLIDPGLLLLDLFIPGMAEHPPGAPIVEVRTVSSREGVRILQRSETYCDVPSRRIAVKTRYESRDRKGATAREDESSALTWYDEKEAATLLGDAGYRDIAVEPAAWPREDGRHFGVIAKA